MSRNPLNALFAQDGLSGPGCENAHKAASNPKPGNSNSLDGLMFAIDGPSRSRCENASNQKPNSSSNNL
jgi:hypothetical protein